MIWEIDDGKQKEVEGLDAAGRPDPAYAAALGLLSAPLGRRALAMVVDIAVLLALQLPFWLGAVPLLLKFGTGTISAYGLVNHPGFVLAIVTTAVTLVLTLVYSLVQWIMHGRRGVTLGKNIAGVRTVNVRTLERPKVGPVLLRFVIVGASGIVPLIGPVLFLSSPAFDPAGRRRGWHDLATGTWLVDVKQGLNPFDEKRMRVARKMVVAEPVAERAELPSLATPVGPDAQPSYRPGNRVSAGVLGVARPHDGRRRPESDQPATPAQPVPGEAGKPVLGGYRSLATDANAPAPASPAPPAMPAATPAPQPAPQATPAAQAPEPLSVAVPTKASPAPEPLSVAVPTKAPEPPSVAVHVEDARKPASTPPASTPPASTPAASTPSAAAPAPAAAPAALALVLDTGERIPVSAPVLLGRNPDASAHAGARPVPMADDTRSLSKTHMLVRPVPGGLEITDCRSTNGSGLVRAGVEYSVAADVPVITIEGDQIRLGDRVATVMRG